MIVPEVGGLALLTHRPLSIPPIKLVLQATVVGVAVVDADDVEVVVVRTAMVAAAVVGADVSGLAVVRATVVGAGVVKEVLSKNE